MTSLDTFLVLIVDDEHLVADTLALIFKNAGYSSRSEYSAEAVMASDLTRSPSLAILDVFLHTVNGVALAHWLREACPDCHILLISGQTATADLLLEEELAGYEWTALPKPFPPQQLLDMSAALLQAG